MGHAGRRISSQHRQLDAFFDMVMEALQRRSLSSARIAFTRFSDALEAHITLEDNVFFPALHGLYRELSRDLTDLVDEHRAFRSRLSELHELLAQGSAESFAPSFERFALQVAEHEAREEAVVSSVPQPPTPGGPFDPTGS
jgi:iron-sulfur cluster repair protein YtfE (RIC family)